MATDVCEFITDLEAGIFSNKLGTAISHCAAACIEKERQAEIKISIKFQRISEGQVNVIHKLEFAYPTQRGTKREDETDSTAMHMDDRGNVSLYPAAPFTRDAQGHLLTEVERRK